MHRRQILRRLTPAAGRDHPHLDLIADGGRKVVNQVAQAASTDEARASVVDVTDSISEKQVAHLARETASITAD